MLLLDREAAIRLVGSLRERLGGRWAEVFAEKRCVLTMRRGDLSGAWISEAWDAGVGIRLVMPNGRIRHSSSTGLTSLSHHTAAQALELGAADGSRSDTAAALPDGQETSQEEGISRWISGEKDALEPFVDSLAVAIGKETPNNCRLEIEAAISCQSLSHLSTDTDLVGDQRTGVRITVLLIGPGSTVRRRWAAESCPDLFGKRDPAACASAIEDARKRLAHAAVAPSGSFPVVFAAGSGGLLIHEAIGHLLEGDLVRREGSLFSSSLAEAGSKDRLPLLSPLLTVSDNPLGLRGRGSYRIDDEGAPARPSMLVDCGRIAGWVGDRWNSTATTGHARRQSHRDPPLPRLACTSCAVGVHDPEEILRDTPAGVYVDELRSGFIDPSSGDFVLHAAEGRMIEGGRLTAGVRDLLILGNAVESLANVDRLGNDLASDGGAHSCVRSGQAIATIVCMPTLRIASIWVRAMAVPRDSR